MPTATTTATDDLRSVIKEVGAGSVSNQPRPSSGPANGVHLKWRQLPKEFPPYSTVQEYFYRWSHDGTWLRINHALVMAAREKAGREASPTAGVTQQRSDR